LLSPDYTHKSSPKAKAKPVTTGAARSWAAPPQTP
jgi:hypothetical protein